MALAASENPQTRAKNQAALLNENDRRALGRFIDQAWNHGDFETAANVTKALSVNQALDLQAEDGSTLRLHLLEGKDGVKRALADFIKKRGGLGSYSISARPLGAVEQDFYPDPMASLDARSPAISKTRPGPLRGIARDRNSPKATSCPGP